MAELELGLTIAKGFDNSPMSDPAQRKDDRVFRQGAQLIRKVAIAGIDLGPDRFVIRRQAFDGIRDATIRQHEIVISGYRLRMRSKAKPVQHLIKKNAGMIAGERSSGRIGTVHARGETDNKKPRGLVAERRHGLAVVAWIAFLDFVEKSRKPRTIATLQIEYALIQSSAVRVVHVANNRLAETPRSQQLRTGNKVIKFLFNVLLALRTLFANRLMNRFP